MSDIIFAVALILISTGFGFVWGYCIGCETGEEKGRKQILKSWEENR